MWCLAAILCLVSACLGQTNFAKADVTMFGESGRESDATLVTTQLEATTFLHCRVDRLGGKTVAWLKRIGQDKDPHLLTYGRQTYSNDARVQITHEKPNNWKLQIQFTKKSDAGLYECQVSTIPPLIQYTYLNVVGTSSQDNSTREVPSDSGPQGLHGDYTDKSSTLTTAGGVREDAESPCLLEYHTAYQGKDLKEHTVKSSALACRDLCNRNQHCKAFVWKESGRSCWLKSGISKKVKERGTTSGTPCKDLLLLDSTKTLKLLELPSFSPLAACSVPNYPISVVDTVSGVGDGQVTLCGGHNYNIRIDGTSCYTLKNGVWTKVHSLKTRRRSAAASMTSKGMLVTGGYYGGVGYEPKTVLQTSERRDITGLWVQGPSLPQPTFLHCQVTVGSDVYILGGSNGDEHFATAYKLEGTKWAQLPNMTTYRAMHACAVLNNSIYVFGGDGSEKSVERLDLASMTWITEPSLLPAADFWSGQAVVYDSTIYLINQDGAVYRLYGDPHMELIASLPQIGYRSTFPTPVVSTADIGCTEWRKSDYTEDDTEDDTDTETAIEATSEKPKAVLAGEALEAPLEKAAELLYIGPGIGDSRGNVINSQSEVLSLTHLSLSRTECSFPPFPGGSYHGYVATETEGGLLFCGGYSNDWAYPDNCFLLTNTQQWLRVARMKEQRMFPAAAHFTGGWWVTGGHGPEGLLDTTELWHSNAWHDHIKLPEAVTGHCIAKINETHVLMMGGATASERYSTSTYLYSKATGFVKQADMKYGRKWHGCALVEDDVVIVAGGDTDKFKSFYGESEYFDMSSLAWAIGPVAIASGIEAPEMLSVNGNTLLIGKRVPYSGANAKIQVLDGSEYPGKSRRWGWYDQGRMTNSRKKFEAFPISLKHCNMTSTDIPEISLQTTTTTWAEMPPSGGK